MITTINEWKKINEEFPSSNFGGEESIVSDAKCSEFTPEELDQALGFLVNYGMDYIENEDSVYQFIQNRDEDNLNDESVKKMLDLLLRIRGKYEGS